MGLQLEAEAQARADAEAVASRAQAALKQHLLESVNVQRDLEEQLHALTLDSTTKVGACVCTTTPQHVPHVSRYLTGVAADSSPSSRRRGGGA